MPREMGLPKYYDFSKITVGEHLVNKGEYVGATQGKFGAQHNFIEIDSGQHVVLSGGSLDWRVEQGHMSEGEVFDIFFDGKETLTKGTYAGKEAKNFKFLKYEEHELPERFRKTGKSAAPAVATAAVASDAQTEALDDLC